MKNLPVGLLEVGSFVAGVLIGFSILVPVFALMVVDPSNWQTLWILGAPVILALGLALQGVVTAKRRHRRTTAPELGVLPIRFMKLSHER
jgi:cytochrome c biogenesis protein CcdA